MCLLTGRSIVSTVFWHPDVSTRGYIILESWCIIAGIILFVTMSSFWVEGGREARVRRTSLPLPSFSMSNIIIIGIFLLCHKQNDHIHKPQGSVSKQSNPRKPRKRTSAVKKEPEDDWVIPTTRLCTENWSLRAFTVFHVLYFVNFTKLKL